MSRTLKRPRDEIPTEYIKEAGRKGAGLHPHWRKRFPDDEADDVGRGKVEAGLPDHGVWRRIPGFFKWLASEDGNIMKVGDKKVRHLSRHPSFYTTVRIDRVQKVHLLVCRAFHGAPTSMQTSVNHGGDVNLDPHVRRADNRACNLSWSTAAEQRQDQKQRKPSSTGEPCLVWKVQGGDKSMPGAMSPMELPTFYTSCKAAADALGMFQSQLSQVFLRKCNRATDKQGLSYTGIYQARDDTDLPGENWKIFAANMKISCRGRIQTKHSAGGRWGIKRFPAERNDEGYAMINSGGKGRGLHTIVGELFYTGVYPEVWDVWDHINQVKTDNRIENLRPVTNSQNAKNVNRVYRPFYLWVVGKEEDRVLCTQGQKEAAQIYGINCDNLNKMLNSKIRPNGSVMHSVNGYSAAFA